MRFALRFFCEELFHGFLGLGGFWLFVGHGLVVLTFTGAIEVYLSNLGWEGKL